MVGVRVPSPVGFILRFREAGSSQTSQKALE